MYVFSINSISTQRALPNQPLFHVPKRTATLRYPASPTFSPKSAAISMIRYGNCPTSKSNVASLSEGGWGLLGVATARTLLSACSGRKKQSDLCAQTAVITMYDTPRSLTLVQRSPCGVRDLTPLLARLDCVCWCSEEILLVNSRRPSTSIVCGSWEIDALIQNRHLNSHPVLESSNSEPLQ
jgi:hypothetical protein